MNTSPQNIFVGKGAKPGLMGGCYIQGRGRLFIGDYVEMGPNCSIISGNHGLYKQTELIRKETIIGDHCWIASNCCILAGIVLGPRTVVAAGSVVTKSFPQGYCIIGGNPAKKLKELDQNLFIENKIEPEFYGFIPAKKIRKYKQKYLGHINFDYDISTVSKNEFYQK